MTGDPTVPDGFSTQEIVRNIRDDVRELSVELRALSAKLDASTVGHEVRHATEQVFLAAQHAEPSGTPAGKSLLSDIDEVAAALREETFNRQESDRVAESARTALGSIVGRHESLIQRMIGAGSVVTVMFTIYEALRQARVIVP